MSGSIDRHHQNPIFWEVMVVVFGSIISIGVDSCGSGVEEGWR
jgi:hypothetical protein